MRIVIVGATTVAALTAEHLLQRGHEVVLVDSDRARIDELGQTLDCAFVHGDGSKPSILRETNPKQSDLLYCLTENDPVNIIASLVGRSLGFRRVVTRIHSELESICQELGLEEPIVPDRAISRFLVDMAEGVDTLELSTRVRGDARLIGFVATEAEAVAPPDLDLPEEAAAVGYYRDERFHLVHADTRFKAGDEVLVLTHAKHLEELHERWKPHAPGAGA